MATGKQILVAIITVSFIITCYYSQEFLMPSVSQTFTRHIDVTTQLISNDKMKIFDNNGHGEVATVFNDIKNIIVYDSGNNKIRSPSFDATQITKVIHKAYRTTVTSTEDTDFAKSNNTNKIQKAGNHAVFIPADEISSLVGTRLKKERTKLSLAFNTSQSEAKINLGGGAADNESVSYDSTVVGVNDEFSSQSEISNVAQLNMNFDFEVEDEIVSTSQSNSTSPSKSDKVQVIILTQKRSGSSFVGELFNQNADFTYFFEPLSSMSTRMLKRLTKGDFTQYARQILSGILHSDFTHMPTGWWSVHVPRQICSSLSLAPLVSRLCGQKESRRRPLSLIEKMRLLSSSTKSRTGIAIKTIRLQDVKSIKDVVTDPKLNVKVLHLVRDPRGVMNSRRRLRESNFDLIRRKGLRADEVVDVCQHMTRHLHYRDNLEWLDGRYKVVRYEDIAEQPLKIASEIYQFLGLHLPPSVSVWLQMHTNHSAGTAFSHTRDSKKAAHAWRQQMDYRRLLEIQHKCARAMTLLGYIPMRNYFDLRNPQIKSFKKLPAA